MLAFTREYIVAAVEDLAPVLWTSEEIKAGRFDVYRNGILFAENITAFEMYTTIAIVAPMCSRSYKKRAYIARALTRGRVAERKTILSKSLTGACYDVHSPLYQRPTKE